MPKSGLNVALKGLDDIFSTEESRQEEQREQVQQIPVSELFPFKNHPFKVLDDDSMTRTVESISQFGVLAPLIARPRPEGGYEIISGHRRKHAAELANLDTVPVIVRNMEDDAATILMVDSNLQREHILPSERAFAYKMKLDAIKNQGARSDLTSSQVGTKLRADEKVAKDSGESRNQVQRFVRLTNLVPELLDMVDEKKISFNPAVELSYLDEKQQQDFLEAMDASQNAPSLSQAIRIKKLAQQGEFDYDAVYNIMNEEKKSELDTVTIKNETLRKYFPRNYTPRQMESIIIQTTQEVEIYFNFVGRFVPPAFGEVELTPEELEEIRKREERKDRLHQNYLKRKASGAQKRYEDKIKGRKKAEIEAKKAAIRAEDIAKGVFVPVSSLPQREPQKGTQIA